MAAEKAFTQTTVRASGGQICGRRLNVEMLTTVITPMQCEDGRTQTLGGPIQPILINTQQDTAIHMVKVQCGREMIPLEQIPQLWELGPYPGPQNDFREGDKTNFSAGHVGTVPVSVDCWVKAPWLGQSALG